MSHIDNGAEFRHDVNQSTFISGEPVNRSFPWGVLVSPFIFIAGLTIALSFIWMIFAIIDRWLSPPKLPRSVVAPLPTIELVNVAVPEPVPELAP
ncbi:hypothetical protein MtrunA17_Chr3g0093951 [Medicago truncatula]|uniref:Transmembrane protein n=1 Tax=Medicago truncatula TaxID=3880 RepID=A0A396IPL9_MEDTR|nr:hypothetical protein MtrunA17_Chr3g0093951 [Medicago truncatula]